MNIANMKVDGVNDGSPGGGSGVLRLQLLKFDHSKEGIGEE